MDKRGQAEVWEITLLFELVVAVLIAIFLIATVMSFNSLSGLNKAYLEKDIKLLVNAELAAPGKIRIDYPVSEDYKVKMGKEIEVTHDITAKGVLGGSKLVFEKAEGSKDIKMSREAKT
jgi:hypothetical protein